MRNIVSHRETQVRTAVGCSFMYARLSVVKKTIVSIGEDTEKLGPSVICCWWQCRVMHLGKKQKMYAI